LRVNPKRLKIIRITAWASLLALTFSFAGLSLLSAANYTDVAFAKLSVEIGADLVIEASGLGTSGEVLDGTVFWYNATINVSNPSQRTVKLQYIKYQGWIEDYITEDHFGGTFTSYYPMLTANQSYPANSGIIAPQSAETYQMNWTLSHPQQLVYFEGTQQILNYVLLNSSRHLRWDQASWNHFFVFRLTVTNVPTDYYGPNSDYLSQLPVITKTQGVSHGS